MEIFDAGLLQRFFPWLAQIYRLAGVRAGEQQWGVQSPPNPRVFLHQFQRLAGQGYAAHIAILGFAQGEPAARQVHIPPFQVHDFALPHAGTQGEDHHGVKAGVLAGLALSQQRRPFVIGQEANAPTGFLGLGDFAHGRIIKPLVFLHRDGQAVRQRRQIAHHGRRGAGLVAGESSRQLVPPFSNQGRGQVGQGINPKLVLPPGQLSFCVRPIALTGEHVHHVAVNQFREGVPLPFTGLEVAPLSNRRLGLLRPAPGIREPVKAGGLNRRALEANADPIGDFAVVRRVLIEGRHAAFSKVQTVAKAYNKRR